MHEHRFHGDISRLRRPERLALLEVNRVVELTTQDGNLRRILDVGTGSGIFAEAFALAGFEVEGLDASPEMLAVARGLVPGVTFQEGIAESLPYPDTSFDLVFMGLLFHETDDRLKALQEASRVTRQRVAILEWPHTKQYDGPELEDRLTAKDIKGLAGQARLIPLQVFHLHALDLYLFKR
jgi:ubiquinone/menaquinone biosynthesis C-methylase UbiE